MDRKRPYLVVPKLVEQPTWGGDYIAIVKGWKDSHNLGKLKIGQSYELFSGSNLSLCDTTLDPTFKGEITDRDTVQVPTTLDNTISLSKLIESSPSDILGKDIVTNRGPKITILIKYTQALGNSFQVHMKSGVRHTVWKPKPESWYFFERGLITLGVKPDINWEAYKKASLIIDEGMQELGKRVNAKELSYEAAKQKAAALIKANNPWQFVNTVTVEKDQLVDLSSGGIHHSWEEDPDKLPHGNVLYEIQAEAMDDISTFRNFDKGKMSKDGSIRQLHIENYFKYIDRTAKTNNPSNHIVDAHVLSKGDTYTLELLLESPFYSMNKLSLPRRNNTYEAQLESYKHLFVKSGKAKIVTESCGVTVTTGHSCFIPAAAGKYHVRSLDDQTEIIICY